MTSPNRYIFAVWTLLILVVGTSIVYGIEENQNSPEVDEIKAVFRISKTFLDDVADRTIVADIQMGATVLKFQCTGVIHGEGHLAVAMRNSGQSAVFEVTSQGNGSVCVRGIRGPFVAYGRAWGPFTTKTQIQFDGRRFTYLSTTPCATVQAEVQRISGSRDRRIGRLVGARILPLTEKLIPKAIDQATPIANGYLKKFVEETADEIITKLNEKTPIEASINRLFPETEDWVFQMSSDKDFMQAAYGEPNAPIPVLPEVAAELEEVRLEVWLRSSDEEAKALADLSKQPLAKQLIQAYLVATLPELAALAEQRTIDAVGEWVVIRIGKPTPN